MKYGSVDLPAVLTLQALGSDTFQASNPSSTRRRVFGGQLLAQALMAACSTVEGQLPRSMHANFIAAGKADDPIFYEVQRLRDGRSMSTRWVSAKQNQALLFSAVVSFASNSDQGLFQHQTAMPVVPGPEELGEFDYTDPETGQVPAHIRRKYGLRREVVDLRPVFPGPYFGRPLQNGQANNWMRVVQPIGADQIFQMCALAYISDVSLIDAALAPHGKSTLYDELSGASLDHALWFHGQFDVRQWLLFVQESPIFSASRGLCRGLVYRRDGALVASVVQEALIRHDALPQQGSLGSEPHHA